jgi:hypothetical protein
MNVKAILKYNKLSGEKRAIIRIQFKKLTISYIPYKKLKLFIFFIIILF